VVGDGLQDRAADDTERLEAGKLGLDRDAGLGGRVDQGATVRQDRRARVLPWR